MAAVVLGGTGAVGHQIVLQLLQSDAWSSVVCIGRRQVDVGPAPPPGKLRQVVLDLDSLATSAAAADAMRGADAVFCALGTTRAAAGSADAFRRVDHDYVAAAAALAKAAGVGWFGLVSAQGANARAPASDWRLLHPFLYAHTKGRAEEAVRAQGFARTAIFRPGMLDRGDKARGIEKLFAPLTGSIAVSDVAASMLADAAAARRGEVSGEDTFEMAPLLAAAAARRRGAAA